MAGKAYIIKGFLILITLLFSTVALAEEEQWVAVLLSQSEEAFEMPVRSFNDSIGKEVREFNLHGNIRNHSDLKRLLEKDKPALIFALGAKAAFAAKLWTRTRQDVPVIFAMVLNWQKYGFLKDQSNITGISSEVNPGNQFLSLGMFAPKVRRVGVIYSPKHSREVVSLARQAIDMLGMKLVEHHIESANEFKKSYKMLRDQVDALWVLPDPVTYTLENMSWLERKCLKDKLVCVGPSSNLTQLGLMLSVRADTTNIGVQAASMAKNIIDRGQNPAHLGVMEPLGTHIMLNKRTADRIGVQISSRALDLATEVVE